MLRYNRQNPCEVPVKFIRADSLDNPSIFQSMAGIMADYLSCFKDDNEKCENLKSLRNLAIDRNNFIHKPEKKNGFTQKDTKNILSILDKLITKLKE